MTQYFLEIRSQPTRKGKSGWGGPDAYCAVQVVPEGVERLKVLNRSIAERRGIQIVVFGEGYKHSQGPRSHLGRAIAKAKAFIQEQTNVSV